MRQYTKDSPGCYHEMIHYIADLENTTVSTVDTHTNIRALYKRPDAPKGKHKGLLYKSYNIVVEYSDGTQSRFFINENGQRFDQVYKDKVAVKFYCTRNKRLTEFKTKPNLAGSYKDSLGGGWYSNCQLYEVNGKYFANMECTC